MVTKIKNTVATKVTEERVKSLAGTEKIYAISDGVEGVRVRAYNSGGSRLLRIHIEKEFSRDRHDYTAIDLNMSELVRLIFKADYLNG